MALYLELMSNCTSTVFTEIVCSPRSFSFSSSLSESEIAMCIAANLIVDGCILGDLLITTGGLCSGMSGGSAGGCTAGTAGGGSSP